MKAMKTDEKAQKKTVPPRSAASLSAISAIPKNIILPVNHLAQSLFLDEHPLGKRTETKSNNNK